MEPDMTHHKKHHQEPAQAQQQPAGTPPAEGPPPLPAEPQAADDAAKLRAERDDYLARLQRLSADFVNYQKRAAREMSDIRDTANAELLKRILSVLDDMERAMVAASSVDKDNPLLEGMTLVHKKALTTLEQFGLTALPSEGQPFDPARHQAVSQLPTDQYPPNTVMKELQRGYQFKGRTLRPATVIVSAPPQAPQAEELPESDEDKQ
jgi:molecular chaperone GrpE